MTDPILSPAGIRVIKLLVGRAPQTVADLIDATGVTRTAVTEQLNELVAGGLVERGTERLSGRGRPRHVYKATDASMLLLFANCQSHVVPAIWRALGEIGGGELTKEVVGRVSQELAKHYKQRIRSKNPQERLRKLTGLLREEGGLIESAQENGQTVMRKRSCPFIGMLDDELTICCIDLEMMTEVVGRPLHLSACRHRGDPCCVVEIVNDE